MNVCFGLIFIIPEGVINLLINLSMCCPLVKVLLYMCFNFLCFSDNIMICFDVIKLYRVFVTIYISKLKEPKYFERICTSQKQRNILKEISKYFEKIKFRKISKLLSKYFEILRRFRI